MREFKMIKTIFALTLITFVITPSVNGQGFDGASLGMGRAYGAMATGIDAIAWNPANLVLPRDNFMELNLFAINLNMANSSFNIDNYNRYFTKEGHKGWWSDSDKEAILDLIDEDGLNASINTYNTSGNNQANIIGKQLIFNLLAVQ